MDFWHPLAPKHHAQALAFCQALDLQRARVPATPRQWPLAGFFHYPVHADDWMRAWDFCRTLDDS